MSLSELKDKLTKHPSNTDLALQLAEHYLSEHNPKALIYLDKVKEQGNDQQQTCALEHLAMWHQRNENLFQANDYYTQILTQDSKRVDVVQNKASNLIALGHIAAAMALIKPYLTVATPVLLFQLSQCYGALEDWFAAIKYAKLCLERSKNIEFLSWYYWCLCSVGHVLETQIIKPKLTRAIYQARQQLQAISIDPNALPLLTDKPKLIDYVTTQGRRHQKSPLVCHAKQHLKIMYTSADFNAHPVGLLLRDLFKDHDRNKVEVIGLDLRGISDSYNQQVKNSCDKWYQCHDLSDSQIKAIIKKEDIDVLVDLSGNTSYSRLHLSKQQLAPVQMHFLGNVLTQAHLPYQYYLTTLTELPERLSDSFGEHKIYLPETSFACSRFQEPTASPSRAYYHLPEDAFIFACFSSIQRIDTQALKAWCRILKSCEDALLWIPCKNPKILANLHEFAATQGVTAKRILGKPTGPLSLEAPMRYVDLCLDTLAFSSFTATIIGASHACPTLTLAGNINYNRYGAVLASAANVNELITYSLDEYIKKAIQIYNNSRQLFYYHQKLKSPSPLFNPQNYLKKLESAYFQAHSQACNNCHNNIFVS